jgi:hypothetical protein
MKHHAARIDVLDLQAADLAQTQAGRVAGREQGTILGLTQRREEGRQFLCH